MTPEVRAARENWLTVYGALKLLVESVLRLHGRTERMSEIFDDLAEIHRAPGVNDGETPAQPPTTPATPPTSQVVAPAPAAAPPVPAASAQAPAAAVIASAPPAQVPTAAPDAPAPNAA